ncbi:MAG TPA: XRE family transcriptional regulator [Burkholderiales bacterium]|nr:XRE family transcriptional regulator [Burkholderiales bacterium]
MRKRRFASVWDAIEETPAEAANMKARAELMIAVAEFIRARRLTQGAAAKLFGVSQPRVSDLMRGKIELFSVDTLVNMLAAAGVRVELRLKKAA